LPNDAVYVSPTLTNIGLVIGPAGCGMFADSWPWAPDGMLSDQNVTLCGTPETTVQRTPSPRLIVSDAGSKRDPVASPIILTSQVFPVIGAAVPVGAAAVEPGAGFDGGAAALEPALGFSPPPPQAAVNAIRTTSGKHGLDMVRSLFALTRRDSRATRAEERRERDVGRVWRIPAPTTNMGYTP